MLVRVRWYDTSSILEKSVWKIAFPVESILSANQILIREHMLLAIIQWYSGITLHST